MTFIIVLFLFLLGLAVGSFLNVVIYRTIHGKSWVKGRSKCDFCQTQIRWYDNIPLLSFLVLKGQTRCCQQTIPLSYPIIELITGVLFVWWYLVGFLFFRLSTAPLQTLQPLFWLLVGVLLLIIFFADLFYMIIPDLAVGILLAITVLYRVFLTATAVMQLKDLLTALLGMAAAVSILAGLRWITRGKGMGLGDVKFAAPMALLLGWPKIGVGLFLAFMLGGIVALGLLVLGKKKMDQVIPFGPFLVIATILGLIWGEIILNWYLLWL